jgi:hypothetical protein
MKIILPILTYNVYISSCHGRAVEERYLLLSSYIPWAVRAARRSTGLMTYMYEKNLHIPIDIVRQELNVEPAPALISSDGVHGKV